MPAEVLDAADRCLTVARYGVGVDNIDVGHATELGILVSNVPEFCTEEVADHTLRSRSRRCATCSQRPTPAAGDGARSRYPSRRLRGLVFGIIGFGATGRAVAERAAAFGFEVIVSSRALAADPGAVPSP